MPAVVGQYVDQIVTTELRPVSNMPRGVAHLLYQAVRPRSEGPLSFAMARGLVDRVEPGDQVLIVCGAGGAPSLPTGEIDGLLGAAALARALVLGLGAEVCLVVEERFRLPMTAIARAGELNVRAVDAPPWPGSVTVRVSPEDDAAGLSFSMAILEELRPSAIVAIEKLSVNRVGVIHGATGNPWHDEHFDAAPLIGEARRRGILTCGIGDAGNEIGFGSIPEVQQIQPQGAVCRCPCGAGMASAVSTDLLVTAAISDWGGYGVVALLALLLGRADLVAGADYVERLLRTAVDAGVVCGWYARPVLCDDGVPLAAQRAAATLIETAVTQALLPAVPSPSH